MQDEQNNLDRDIPADVQHLSDEDIGAWSRHFFNERAQLLQSIQDSLSQRLEMEAKLTKGLVNEPYSQDSVGIVRAGFLPRLLEALHHSRRLQAARVIRSYKHLINPDREYRLPGDLTKRSSKMSLNEAPSPATKVSPAVKVLIAAVLLGFVIFHIVGDAVLRTPLAAAKADMVGSNKYGD